MLAHLHLEIPRAHSKVLFSLPSLCRYISRQPHPVLGFAHQTHGSEVSHSSLSSRLQVYMLNCLVNIHSNFSN